MPGGKKCVLLFLFLLFTTVNYQIKVRKFPLLFSNSTKDLFLLQEERVSFLSLIKTCEAYEYSHTHRLKWQDHFISNSILYSEGLQEIGKLTLVLNFVTDTISKKANSLFFS